MRVGWLVLAALLLGMGLATAAPARAGSPAQAAVTPQVTTSAGQGGGLGTGGTPAAPPGAPGDAGNGAPPAAGAGGTGVGSTGANAAGAPSTEPAPANLVGQEPNLAVGYFLPVCLIVALLVAGVGALVAIRRDTRKAERMTGRDAPDVH